MYNTPEDGLRSAASVTQRIDLIQRNLSRTKSDPKQGETPMLFDLPLEQLQTYRPAS